MSVSKVTKIQLMVVRDHHADVMDVLHRGGFMEIDTWQIAEGDMRFQPASRSHYWQTNVKFAIDLLKPLADEQKQSFLEKLRAGRPQVTPEDIQKLLSEFDYRHLIDELTTIDKERNRIKNLISQHKRELKSLKVWEKLPQVTPGSSPFVTIALGTVPIVRYEEFTAAIAKLEKADVQKISESDKEVHIILTYTNDIAESVQTLGHEVDFKTVDLELSGAATVAERLTHLQKEITELEQEQHGYDQKLAQYLPHLNNFYIVYDYLTWKSEEDEASTQGLATKETVNLRGWIQERRLPELKELIESVTDEYEIDEIAPDEGESIPVILENGPMVSPFESVTDIYGAPQYNEPDPTIYLAPFFILYFALCLTDAGYGLVLALLAFVALKLMKPTGGAKKMMRLMVMGGIVTFVIGALFGGWFGIVLDDLPAGPFRDFTLAFRMIDPVANPMSVLILSFILGFIQLVVGNIVNMMWKIRHGEAAEGILSSGVWAVFLLIIGFWVAVQAGVLPSFPSVVAQYILYAGLVLLILTQGRDGKNIFLKLFKGVASLYGLVGYLSDILSYSRLLALGLSTGIIAMVVNIIASLFADMVPFVGPVVWLVIIVGGHLFNLAINVLGAFIHAGRLQFVEYFPKFLTGGGRKFKPLVRTSKYVTVINK